MLDQATLQTLRGFKLFGMAEALEQQFKESDVQSLSFEERMGLLIDRESTSRDNRRLTRLLRLAKLREQAYVEDIDYRHPRGLQKSLMTSLATSGWVRKAQNVCLSGPTGTGKTYLACAATRLVGRACQCGIGGCRGSSRRCASPMAMAATLACSRASPKPTCSSWMTGVCKSQLTKSAMTSLKS